jgi:hypothetical protein
MHQDAQADRQVFAAVQAQIESRAIIIAKQKSEAATPRIFCLKPNISRFRAF